MPSLYFLVIVAVTIASAESKDVSVNKRVLDDLGGLLGGDSGLLGGLVGKKGLVCVILKTVKDLVAAALKIVYGLTGSLTGKTAEEQKSVFDKYPLTDLCPLCPRLPADHAKSCGIYCKAKGWKSTQKEY